MSRGVTVSFNAEIARFTSSVDKMSNDLTKFQTNASRTAANIDKSFAGIGTSIKAAFGGITAALSVRELATMADTFSGIQARLKLATRDANEFAEANAHIQRIASTAKAPLEETATLYTRISQSLVAMGGTQQQVADTTQALALSLKLSGATGAEAASVMLQFSQTLNKGKFQAQEFNSVAAGAPRVLKALADSLGVPVAKLRDLMEQGKLTTDVLVNALGQQLPTLIKEAGSVPDTISASFTELGNVLLTTVGKMDQVTGASGRVAKAISSIGAAIDKVGTSVKSGGFFSFLNTSGEEERNAEATIAGLKEKLGKLRKLRDELSAPTLGNKINNSFIGNILGLGPTDLDTVNVQIASTVDKITYLSALVQKSKVEASKPFQPLAIPVAPDTAKLEAQVKAAQAAYATLQKEGASLAASVDPIVKRNQELAKYVELLQKGAISQQTFDLAATKSIASAQAALDSVDRSLIAAKQAQEALDALTKEGENLKLAVDPFYKLNKEVERYSELLEKGVIDQRTFELAVEKSMGKSVDVVKDSADKMDAAMIGFQTNVQSTLGQGLYNAMTGKFDSIFDAWKDLLFRMISAGLASHLTDSIFGGNGSSGLLKGGLNILSSLLGGFGGGKSAGGTKLGSSNFGQFLWPTFATGGDFGGGMRLVGERGPELEVTGPSRIFNANQTKDILNGGKSGVSVNYAPVIQIDSRADRTEVHQIVSRAVKQGNADLVEKLNRQGVL